MKKGLSVILSLCMVLTAILIVPINAAAADLPETETGALADLVETSAPETSVDTIAPDDAADTDVPEDLEPANAPETPADNGSAEDLAETGATEYTYGNYKYELMTDGTVRIKKYTGRETTVNIPSTISGKTVTEIGHSAFSNSETPEIITVPDTVKKIGYCAFTCKWLEKITIGASVETIEYRAFDGDSCLKTVIFKGSKLKTIEHTAFWKCKSLDNVKLPNSVTSIGEGAFLGCSGMKSISLGNSLTTLGYRVFQNCESLLSITLPDTLRELPGTLFSGCISLKSVQMPKYLKEIGYNVFTKCKSLASVSLPDSLTKIGSCTFQNCSALKQLVIPNSVTEIGAYICDGCTALTDVKLSESLEIIPDAAFRDCSMLKRIKLPDRVTDVKWEAFQNCKALASFVSKSVRNIGSSAFWRCSSLKSAVLGNALKEIEYDAFYGCEKLSALYIPKTLRTVANYVFYKCANPMHVYFSGSKTTWNNEVAVGSSNTSLTAAVFHYNYNYSSLYATIYPTAVKFAKSTYTAYVGKTMTLPLTYTPSNTTEKWLTCSSSNSKIATVNNNGVVTGKGLGTVVITVKTDNGLTARCNVTVTHATPSLKSIASTAGGVTFSWAKVPGAAKYRAFLKSGGKWLKIGDTTGTAFTFKKAKSGKKYIFTVRCISSNGKTYTSSFNSNGWAITFIATPGLATLKNTKSGVQVTWKKVAGAAKYRVFRKTGSGSWVKVADTASVKIVDKSAKNGVTYRYTIRCISANGKKFTSAYNTSGRAIKCKR